MVQAYRWVEKNKSAVAKQNFAGLDAESWDPSVKAMARFPTVLKKMNDDLDWTTALGDAIINQPEDVANVIQILRAKAEKSGALKSGKEIKVVKKKEGPREIVDSDIVVPPNYLANVMANLSQPGVGLATCPYRGVGATGIWSRLAAAGIDYQFLPNVLVGLKLGLATPCFGSTIALTKTTLTKLGGLQSVADQLADDYALGMAVRRVGLQVAIPPFIVTHVCAERSLRELLLHEIRWARTIRAMDSLGFAGLAVTYAVPIALLGVILGGLTPAASVLVVALACRFALQAELHRLLQLRNGIFWLGPIRDILSFVVFVASFFGRRVEWRGHRYGVKADHTLAYYGEVET